MVTETSALIKSRFPLPGNTIYPEGDLDERIYEIFRHSAFTGFPITQAHYLWIDLDRAILGPLCFDVEEPGYASGMQNAFKMIFDSLGRQFSSKDFEDLHFECTGPIRSFEEKSFYRHCSMTSYGLCNVPSKLAWEELASTLVPRVLASRTGRTGLFAYVDWTKASFLKNRKTSPKEQILEYPKGKELFSLCHMSLNFEQIALPFESIMEIVDFFFTQYYKQIRLAVTEEGKLHTIVILCRSLEVFHAFTDGNQRTIAFALLTKLLIENGFSPAILRDPTIFDGYYTVKQMIKCVRQGMERFEYLKTDDFNKADRLFMNERAEKRAACLYYKLPYMEKAFPLRQSAIGLAEQKRTEEALAIATEMRGSQYYNLLQEIARILARQGEWKKADRIIDQIPSQKAFLEMVKEIHFYRQSHFLSDYEKINGIWRSI